jgi:hypothetical protein
MRHEEAAGAAFGHQLDRRALKLIQIMPTIKRVQPKYGTDKIEVMTRATSQAPSRAGKHAEPFGDVGEHHER